MRKLAFGVLVVLLVPAFMLGCAQTPVTFGPYASYGGDEGAGPQQWQVGVGAWFVLGKEGVVVPPAAVPSMPSSVRVEQGNPQGPSTTNNNTTNQNTTNNTGPTTVNNTGPTTVNEGDKNHHNNNVK